jgi:inhibitor of KinA
MHTYDIFPLGDAALTLDFGHQIDPKINQIVVNLYQQLSATPFVGFVEAAPAYSSLTVFYDVFLLKKTFPNALAFDTAKAFVLENYSKIIDNQFFINKKNTISIPVCYNGKDLKTFAATKKSNVEDIIKIHSARVYQVYMLGFQPGFAYMASLDARLEAPRKSKPEMIRAGAVAVAGLQTGVYPFDSPGGWQVLGHTPLRFFDTERTPTTLLHAGDFVQFYPITAHEFESY